MALAVPPGEDRIVSASSRAPCPFTDVHSAPHARRISAFLRGRTPAPSRPVHKKSPIPDAMFAMALEDGVKAGPWGF